MKKVLVLGAFLMIFGSAAALAQEISNLNPRQLLLLQVPVEFSITMNTDVSIITWRVSRENGEPLEVIAITTPPEKVIYLTLGEKPRGVAGFTLNLSSPERLVPETLGKFDDRGDFKMLESPYNLAPETEKEIGAAIIKAVKEILEAFDILTDEQLAEFIKKNFAGEKTAI